MHFFFQKAEEENTSNSWGQLFFTPVPKAKTIQAENKTKNTTDQYSWTYASQFLTDGLFSLRSCTVFMFRPTPISGKISAVHSLVLRTPCSSLLLHRLNVHSITFSQNSTYHHFNFFLPSSPQLECSLFRAATKPKSSLNLSQHNLLQSRYVINIWSHSWFSSPSPALLKLLNSCPSFFSQYLLRLFIFTSSSPY